MLEVSKATIMLSDSLEGLTELRSCRAYHYGLL